MDADGFVTGGNYTVTCTTTEDCVSSANGAITVVPKCVVSAPPVEICEGKTLAELEDAIEAEVPGCTGVGCDATPVLSYANVIVDADGFVTGGNYTVTCTTTEDCVSSANGAITVVPKCVVSAPPVEICEGKTLAELEDAIEAEVPGCTGEGCDATPVSSYENVIVDEETGFVTGGNYTVTCTTTEDCVSSANGAITVVPKCPDCELIGLTATCVSPVELEALIMDTNEFACGDCNAAPRFKFPVWPVNARWKCSGRHIYQYTVTCNPGDLEG